MQKNEYCAVIVTYNPDIETIKNSEKALAGQGFRVVFVDNNSNNIEAIKEALKQSDVIALNQNQGVAAALNRGFSFAQKIGAEWVLTLDQDTQVAENLLIEYKKYLDLPHLGALTPSIVRRGRRDVIDESQEISIIDKCPTAGFMQSIASWTAVNGYDEWLFIDYVDYDMCARLRGNGFLIYKVPSTHVVQELGNIHYNEFFYTLGKKLGIRKIRSFSVTYNHSPLRNYYYIRNGLYYIHKHKKVINVSHERKIMIKWELRKIFLEKRKGENIKAIIKGIHDYRAKINN